MQLRPLADIRVLDFTTLPPGAACTVLLADLGAEVIRVEPTGQKGKPSLIFGQVALSRGKRSISLDMRNPEASSVLRRLAETSDVIVENAKPGSMEMRGFGYRHALEVNPRIIWCAVTGFGQDGPNADHAGHDLSYLAHSGLLGALSGDLSWLPGQGLALPAGALSAVIAIQAALIQRGKSGVGAFLDISLSEAAGWFLACGINPLSDRPLILAATPDRRLYRCGDDRFVAVACAEPRTWGALCDGLNLPGLKPNLHQTDVAEATAGALAERFMTRSAAEWVDQLAPAGAAVTIVNRGRQVIEDPHVRARASVVNVAGIPVPASPIRIEAPDGNRTGMADLATASVGDDTVGVLTDIGYSEVEIATLTKSGIL